jgi:signal transduction histidine kinase
MAVAALSFLHLIDTRQTLLTQVDPAGLAADQLLLSYVDQETGVRGYILGHNVVFLEPSVQGVIDQEKEQKALARDLAQQPSLYRLVRQAEAQAERWQRVFARPAIAATEAGSTLYGSPAALNRSKTLFDGIRQRFVALTNALSMARVNDGNSLTTATNQLMAVLAGGMALLLVAAILLRLALRSWVARPLAQLATDAREVRQGQLSHSIVPAGPVEIQTLAADVEAMRQRIVAEFDLVASARADLDAKNDDLARTNRELEQFAYVASHDLQEPLRKVTSFVQLLEERYRGQLDDRAQQYIGLAVDGAARMQRLINDLLMFSRVGASSEGITEVAMGECLQAALENLDEAIRDAGATIDTDYLPEVAGDRILLTSLWQNLVANSIKFRGDGPPQVVIEGATTDGEHVFSVTDNGIGIDHKFAEKIFVIFQRLHGREAYSGTGIGLALCRKIVDFHGGRIWLDTGPHPGTRICFTIPIPQSDAEGSE